MYTFPLPCTHNRHFPLAVFWSIENLCYTTLSQHSLSIPRGVVGALPPYCAFTISAGTYFSDIKNSFLFLFEVRKIASAIITILPSRLSALFSYNPVIFANKKNRVIRFQPTVPRSLWKGAEAICYCTVAPSSSLKVGALATDAYGHESALKPLVLSARQLLYQLAKK